MVFECIFAANRKLPSGLITNSLSSSRSRLAVVGFGSYKPVPCVANGEPVTAFNLPVPSLLKARIELWLGPQVGHSPVLLITYTRFICAKEEPSRQSTNRRATSGIRRWDKSRRQIVDTELGIVFPFDRFVESSIRVLLGSFRGLQKPRRRGARR